MTVIVDGTNGVSTPLITNTGSVAYTSGQTYAGTITQGTVVAATSGTSIDFTGIPSWVKRITVMFNGVGLNAGSEFQIQIGSGSVISTGYGSSSARLNAGGTGLPAASFTSGFQVTNGYSSGTINGFAFIVAMPSLSYGYSSNIGFGTSNNTVGTSTGVVTLSGVLDRVRITSVSGTAAFNAGSINILYE